MAFFHLLELLHKNYHTNKVLNTTDKATTITNSRVPSTQKTTKLFCLISIIQRGRLWEGDFFDEVLLSECNPIVFNNSFILFFLMFIFIYARFSANGMP